MSTTNKPLTKMGEIKARGNWPKMDFYAIRPLPPELVGVLKEPGSVQVLVDSLGEYQWINTVTDHLELFTSEKVIDEHGFTANDYCRMSMEAVRGPQNVYITFNAQTGILGQCEPGLRREYIAETLKSVAESIRSGDSEGSITDINGAVIGGFTIKERQI